MWLQDNRTFSGGSCVEFLLQRQTWLERQGMHQHRETPVLHKALNNWKKPWLPKDFELCCSLWINFPIFSPSWPDNFFPAHVLVLISQRDFAETSPTQKCTLIFWNVGEGVRGGFVNGQCSGEFWISDVCLLWLSDILRFAISRLLCLLFCVGFCFNPTKLSDSSSVPGPNSILMLSLLASWFKVEIWWKTSFQSSYCKIGLMR